MSSKPNQLSPGILHVGFPKTGTTTLQKHLLPAFNKDSDFGTVRGMSFNFDARLFYLFRQIGNPQLYGTPFLKDLYSHNLNAKPWFLSHEGILTLRNRPEEVFRNLSNVLHHDTRILITWRNPTDLAGSLFGEYVKSATYHDEEQFLDEFDRWTFCPKQAFTAASKYFDTVVTVKSSELHDSRWVKPLLQGLVPEEKFKFFENSVSAMSQQTENVTPTSRTIGMHRALNSKFESIWRFSAHNGSSTPISYLSLADKLVEAPRRVFTLFKAPFLQMLLRLPRVRKKHADFSLSRKFTEYWESNHEMAGIEAYKRKPG